MRNVWIRTLVLLASAGLVLAWRVQHPVGRTQLVRVQRTLMGTVWEIQASDHGDAAAAQRAIEAAYAELERIDQLMSEWKPTSPISQVNAAAGNHAVETPDELRDLLLRSIEYSRLSGGAFDVTWRGMGRIWRFDEGFRTPAPEEVREARRRIDYRRIAIRGNTVELPAGMSIGLGGIAKGYAVDCAMEVLAARGFHDAMVNGGGDVVTRGTRLGGPWILGIQHPRKERGELMGAVAVRDGALVSSGDYERFRMGADGRRYHHIIDPRTGYPATASQAVTVLAKTAEQGVVLGKAIFILGAEEGLALARSQHVEALVVDASGAVHRTAGFPLL